MTTHKHHRSTKAIVSAALGVLTFAAVISTSPAAITYDGFDYSIGGTLAGNPDWTLLNTGTAPVIAAGNLSIPGLAPATGNKVSTAGGNIQEVIGALNTFNSGTVYFSIAFSLTSLPSGTPTYSFGLATGNTNYGDTVWFQPDVGGVGYNIGVANRSNSTPTYDPTVLSLNTPYFIVGSYTFNSSTGDDMSKLWLNPDSSTFGGTEPAFTLSATGGTDLAQVAQFLVRGAAGSPAYEFDELRVGTSWSEVTVPEPTAFSALLGGTAFLGLIRRRRS